MTPGKCFAGRHSRVEVVVIAHVHVRSCARLKTQKVLPPTILKLTTSNGVVVGYVVIGGTIFPEQEELGFWRGERS